MYYYAYHCLYRRVEFAGDAGLGAYKPGTGRLEICDCRQYCRSGIESGADSQVWSVWRFRWDVGGGICRFICADVIFEEIFGKDKK